ncbi:hypothetical protein PUN28_019022 [Cardiocondyla obscurior]|uniref:Uncharacterized protein n=1 Tax=Cardiocondyla obscurior TaxID=286306 RepID=A0AAW2EF84_9HYME
MHKKGGGREGGENGTSKERKKRRTTHTSARTHTYPRTVITPPRWLGPSAHSAFGSRPCHRLTSRRQSCACGRARGATCQGRHSANVFNLVNFYWKEKKIQNLIKKKRKTPKNLI